ncbi:MAG: hypothetical protein V1857_01065 [archaeon]
MIWTDLGFIGVIRTSTILTALALFFFVLWRLRRPLIALLSVMAWVSLYEILWNLTDLFLHGGSLTHSFWQNTAIISYPILARTQGTRLNRTIMMLFSVFWIIWILSGFNSNNFNVEPFILSNEILNITTKAILAMAYAPITYEK